MTDGAVMRLEARETGTSRIDVAARWSGGSASAFVELPDGLAPGRIGDALVTAALLPAMASGEPELSVSHAVGPPLIRATDTIQDVISSWDLSERPESPRYRRVTVQAEAAPDPIDSGGGRGTACFFTGGVDSFYSVVKNRESIDALVYVHGFDIAPDDDALYERVIPHLRSAAEDLELPLHEFRTDLRRFGEATGAEWPDYHGAALASIAHLLGSRYRRVLVPASWGYAHMEPYGSHPYLDPLWSSDAVEIVHDGAEMNRLGKIRAIADSPVARGNLRVCYRNPDLAYNCGRCNKCVRTAAAVEIAGATDEFGTLAPVTPAEIARLRIRDLSRVTWQDYVDDLRRSDARPDLERAISTALLRQRITAALPTWNLGYRISQLIWAGRYPAAALARARSKLR